jgi:hypothetical protein
VSVFFVASSCLLSLLSDENDVVCFRKESSISCSNSVVLQIFVAAVMFRVTNFNHGFL